MMRIVGRIIRDLRREEITKLYANKNRYIPQNIYTKLKNKKKCDKCGKGLCGLPEIHHIISVEDGGESIESNLMAVHENVTKYLIDNIKKLKEQITFKHT